MSPDPVAVTAVRTEPYRPDWWTGAGAPGRHLLRAVRTVTALAWALLVAVAGVGLAGVAVTPSVLLLAGTVVIALAGILAWQWDTATCAEVAARQAQVAARRAARRRVRAGWSPVDAVAWAVAA